MEKHLYFNFFFLVSPNQVNIRSEKDFKHILCVRVTGPQLEKNRLESYKLALCSQRG